MKDSLELLHGKERADLYRRYARHRVMRTLAERVPVWMPAALEAQRRLGLPEDHDSAMKVACEGVMEQLAPTGILEIAGIRRRRPKPANAAARNGRRDVPAASPIRRVERRHREHRSTSARRRQPAGSGGEEPPGESDPAGPIYFGRADSYSPDGVVATYWVDARIVVAWASPTGFIFDVRYLNAPGRTVPLDVWDFVTFDLPTRLSEGWLDEDSGMYQYVAWFTQALAADAITPDDFGGVVA